MILIMFGEIFEFCKDCLIICILVILVFDEVDGDCLELDELDFELKFLEYEVCLLVS